MDDPLPCAVSVSRRCAAAEVERGDHVFVRRGLFRKHAIALEDGAATVLRLAKEGLVAQPLEEFCRGAPLRRVQYGVSKAEQLMKVSLASGTVSSTPTSNLDLVMDRVQFLQDHPDQVPEYNLMHSRSEAMVVWCKTGRWLSLKKYTKIGGSALVDGGGALYLRVAAGCVCKASLTAPVLAAASWAALGLGAICAAKFALVTLLHPQRRAVEDELGREFAVHCTTRTLDECVAASAFVRRMQNRAYARQAVRSAVRTALGAPGETPLPRGPSWQELLYAPQYGRRPDRVMTA